MADINGGLQGPSLNRRLSKDLVRVEDYDILPKLSAKQKLSPLDMNMPRLYGSRWILCFPLPADTDRANVYELLREGLAHTIASIPWIAGDIGREESSDPEQSQIQVTEGAGGVEFRYKDLTSILPSYTELKAEHFPFSKLMTPLISPIQVFQALQPVLAAQANFISGGLLLTVGVHHSAADAIGLDTILETWALNTSAVASSGSFSKYDPTSNDRSPLSHGLPATVTDFPEYILYPTPPTDPSQMGPPPGLKMPAMEAKIFHFSPSHLAALKAEAKAYSTNDALCAFFWHHMSVARNPNPPSQEQTSSMLFALNIRPRTSPPLPPTYLGNASLGCLTRRLPLPSLTHTSSGLSLAASTIRSAITSSNSPSRVPLTIGLLSSRPNAQDFKFACNGFLGPDITSTSWADIDVRKRAWGGVLGKPEGFRVPYEATDGAIVVLPRLEGGGLEVMVALESGAMWRMVGNEEFGRFAEEWA